MKQKSPPFDELNFMCAYSRMRSKVSAVPEERIKPQPLNWGFFIACLQYHQRADCNKYSVES